MQRDHAIVVGISKYPGLARGGESFDLAGPDRDAEAIRDWLIAADGGDVPAENVKMIRSADYPAATDPWEAQPEHSSIRKQFFALREKGYDAGGSLKVPVGRRLYLYLSGHGFSPGTNQPALLTAEAIPDLLSHLYANAWIEWFRAAGFFEEYVVWVDCCMNPFSQVQEERLPNKIVGGAPGSAFLGIAATTRSALETEMPDGQIHGVFTWTLLEGLRGKAAEGGQITGEGLRKFLYNAMAGYLPKVVREASAVDVKPSVQTDNGIVFRTGVAEPSQKVTVTVPGAADDAVIMAWGGQPPIVSVGGLVKAGQWETQLPRGLYVVEVPTTGHRHGFEVTGSGDVALTVSEMGPAVVPAAADAGFQLSVSAGNVGAVINVIDHNFDRVLSGTGMLAAGEPAGIYKIRVQHGRDISAVCEHILLLDHDTNVPISAPPLSAAAPIRGSAQTHESHVAAFESVAKAEFTTGASILARYWTTEAERQPGAQFPSPFEGLTLVGPNGRQVRGLTAVPQKTAQPTVDPVLVATRDLPPGAYTLRQELPEDRVVESSLIIANGWITQCVLRRSSDDMRAGGVTPHVGSLGDLAVLMRRPGSMFEQGDSAFEAACLALAENRAVFVDNQGQQLLDLLTKKYDNPMAGIVAAHLWLISLKERWTVPPPQPRLLDEVVTNLRTLLGNDHPDVEILSLSCDDRALRTKGPIVAPPMLRRSWDMLVAAAADTSSLVPKELWDRVSAVTSERLSFVWAADERTRTAHRLQMRLSVAGQAAAAPADAPMPAAAGPGGIASGAAAEAGLEGVGLEGVGLEGFTAALRTPADWLRARARELNIVPVALEGLWKAARDRAEVRVNERHFCICLETISTAGRTKVSLLTTYRWPTGAKVRVRFLGGDRRLQGRIRKVARQWVGRGLAHLSFEFVEEGEAEIRISLEPGDASWCYLGTMARNVPPDQPTMNFGWLTKTTTDAELERVVLHEFGHALGLAHEYLLPASPIQWNREAVVAALAAPPARWDEKTVERNVLRQYDARFVSPTPVDATSIMVFPLPATWTRDGFSAGLNQTLSDIDKDFMRVAYPW